ncbi:MAG: hypothetical protein JWM96_1383 [Alphaproteobacteria bacterium]|nr:hypothetical protein [Alphaproteobacteria bacterium]
MLQGARAVPKKKMWVEWEEGADLSRSHKKPGDYSPLTRDADRRLGQVTLSDADEDPSPGPAPAPSPPTATGTQAAAEPETVYVYVTDDRESAAEEQRRAERNEQLAELTLLGLRVVAHLAAPHVRRWWEDKSLPFLKAARARLARDRRIGRRRSGVEPAAVVPPSAPQGGDTDPSQEVLAALDDYRTSMSSAEARDRLAVALAARFFSEEQLRILRDARIDDDGSALELASAMRNLTPQQVRDAITAMLESNPSWPDDFALVELKNALQDGRGGTPGLPGSLPRSSANAPRTIDGEP